MQDSTPESLDLIAKEHDWVFRSESKNAFGYSLSGLLPIAPLALLCSLPGQWAALDTVQRKEPEGG